MDDATHLAVSKLVEGLLPKILDLLIVELRKEGSTPASTKTWSMTLSQKAQREYVCFIAESWQVDSTRPSARDMIMAIEQTRIMLRRATRAEVCWSGPVDSMQGFRTTSSAIAELIANAQSSIVVCTYSSSDVQELREPLERAALRGVAVTLICEIFDVFNQVACPERLLAFGEKVLNTAEVLIWPSEHRRKADGRVFGSMHVKCLLVDGASLVLTSANWSFVAMQDNMELGVVLRDRLLVDRVNSHFANLRLQGVLIPYVL